MPKTKLSIVREFMAAGNWPAALSQAAKFPQLGEQRVAIIRAHNAILRPQFYREIGQDPEQLVAAGIQALKERYK